MREVVALLFVGLWLALLVGELLTGAYTVPVWLHCVGVGVLGYTLGLNVVQITAKPPSARRALQRARG